MNPGRLRLSVVMDPFFRAFPSPTPRATVKAWAPWPSLITSPARALYRLKQRSVAAVLGPAAGIWHSVMTPHERARDKGDTRLLAVIERLHDEALTKDYEAAEAGLYPRSIIFPLPGWHDVRFLPEALLDLPQILRRKRRGDFLVHFVPTRRRWPSVVLHGLRPASWTPSAPVPPGDDVSGALPDYYMRTFHWQTDGWMSAHSARIYELQVEFLFFGTMDVMRRRGLAALVRGLRRGSAGKEPRILDVACGTGRLLEQARAALPNAGLEGVDLSPYYVKRAAARLRGAARDRRRGERHEVRVANAEALGGPDGAYDAVTCGFLFHELPKDARRRVAKELWRVLKPGGLVVVQDSMQRMDPNGRALTAFLDWFPGAYHEPYYKGYTADDLAVILEETGFEVEARDYVLFSKVVVGRKRQVGS